MTGVYEVLIHLVRSRLSAMSRITIRLYDHKSVTLAISCPTVGPTSSASVNNLNTVWLKTWKRMSNLKVKRSNAWYGSFVEIICFVLYCLLTHGTVEIPMRYTPYSVIISVH